jgi:hypothetical protein
MKRSLMKTTLPCLLSAAVALARFMPNVRVDRQDDPDRGCSQPAITLGPGTWSSQPIYIVFEDKLLMVDGDIMFQKSTDAGRTWLTEDVLVKSDAFGYPDITTDPDGNIYVSYQDSLPNRLRCVRSTDGGATWSQPTRVDDREQGGIGWARIAADSAGNLFCAWNDWRTGSGHIWSSVSTDRGATWSQNVRVDQDTTYYDCYHADVFVQPGTNHYLVAAQVPYYYGNWNHGAYLYRSTDMGKTYQPGVWLDANGGCNYTGQPHVVADAQHVICNYTDNGSITEARTLYTQPDTWGVPHLIGTSNANGAKLAISADGYVHTALMAGHDGSFDTYYAFSTDHGVSWSDPELVNEDTITESLDPDIGADSAGHAYIVWRAGSVQHGEIRFATNNLAAIAEQPQPPSGTRPVATVIRNVLFLAERPSSSASTSPLLDISGRDVMYLRPGANDISRLSPGVYFIREGLATGREGLGKTRKVVVTR